MEEKVSLSIKKNKPKRADVRFAPSEQTITSGTNKTRVENHSKQHHVWRKANAAYQHCQETGRRGIIQACLQPKRQQIYITEEKWGTKTCPQ